MLWRFWLVGLRLGLFERGMKREERETWCRWREGLYDCVGIFLMTLVLLLVS